MFARSNLKIACKEAIDAQLVTLTDVRSVISIRESSEREVTLFSKASIKMLNILKLLC